MYLDFGSKESKLIDVAETKKYLATLGADKNALTKARKNDFEPEGDIDFESDYLCDFCFRPLSEISYEELADRRKRCLACSSTVVKGEDAFREIYEDVIQNMEDIFRIEIKRNIHLAMLNAKNMGKNFGYKFIPVPREKVRVLGCTEIKSDGINLLVENGSPALPMIATLAHELTHVWQIQNWLPKQSNRILKKKLRSESELEKWEGMAKWAEIRYLAYIGEINYAGRLLFNILTDETAYGRGFMRYYEELGLRLEKGNMERTPFAE